MRIRGAAEGDLDAVVALLNELHDPPDAVADLGTWRTILGQPGRSLLLADDDGSVVGAIDLLVVPNLTRGGHPWMQIENVVVTAPRRREGIGRALLTEAERIAREGGCYKMQLLSARHREGAHGLYESIGFEPRAEGMRRYL